MARQILPASTTGLPALMAQSLKCLACRRVKRSTVMTLLQNASMVGLVVVSLACDNLTSASSDRPAAEPRAEQQQPANRMGAAVKAFQDRIKEYDTFHHNVQKMVPALDETADPAKISAREKALGEQLIKSRPNAKQGDFFI